MVLSFFINPIGCIGGVSARRSCLFAGAETGRSKKNRTYKANRDNAMYVGGSVGGVTVDMHLCVPFGAERSGLHNDKARATPGRCSPNFIDQSRCMP